MPGAYICGEETALLESLEGKRGFPRIKPPFFPAAIGLYGEPTVVNNVETMSNLPWIVTNGGAAFAALGEGRSTGTRLFALAGHVNNPGVFELEMVKTTFNDLINAPVLGGGIPHGRELKAFIPGGVSAPWFGPDQIDLPLGQDEVAAAGSMLGSGSIVVMDDHTCAVRAAWRITKFFSRESCGQCTPVPRGIGMAGEDHGAHRDRPGSGGGPRSAPRRLRQHRPRTDLAAAADHHLRARAVHPLVHRLGHRRCSATSSWSTSKKGAAPMTEQPTAAGAPPWHRGRRAPRLRGGPVESPSPSTAARSPAARGRC